MWQPETPSKHLTLNVFEGNGFFGLGVEEVFDFSVLGDSSGGVLVSAMSCEMLALT